MLAEPSRDRPLQPLPRRRAATASVVGHGVALALLALVGTRSVAPPGESPLIMAELVTALEPAAAPAPITSDVTAGPEPEESLSEPPIQEEPPPPAEPQPLTVERAPPSGAPQPEPEPAEPFVEPPPAERVVEVLEPPPAAAVPTEPVEPVQPIGPRRALATHEERAVLRKLSSWTGQLSADEPDATLSWRDDGQQYTAVLKQVPAADAMGMEQLAVELTTQRDGERLVTELRMNRIAFSNFAQFIDRWDPEVQIHDDLIDGRFHSNSEINVSRDGRVRPVFNGKVTLAAGDIRTEGPGFLNRRTMFPAGLETSVRRIVLPPRAATFDRAVVPADRVARFEQDSLITFLPDGSFETQALSDGAAGQSGTLGDEPYYLLGGEDVALHVRGNVNGKVLVYSPARIVIVGDLRYVDDPRMPGAGDYLGLVAERTVEIDEPEVTGAGDLEVHASIYARSRFLVRSYHSRRSGTLIIYGSVAAGSVSATEPRFATRIEFDDRLTTMRAPGFPLSDRYELDSTSSEWRVVGAAN
jgi:hypothetical protein